MAIDPTTPTGYTAGSITVQGATVSSLYDLVSVQLDPHVSPGDSNFTIQADKNNLGPVFIGNPRNTVGVLSATNYGRSLQPGEVKDYYSAGPSANLPMGRVFVFAAAQSVLHVEIFPC